MLPTPATRTIARLLASAVLLPCALLPAGARAAEWEQGTWPQSAVGRVNVVLGAGRRSHCTGTLVGPRHVLTAAHCLFDKARRRWAHPSSVHFVAGYARGSHTAHSAAASYAKGDFVHTDEPRAEMLPHDWAVIELAEALPLKPVPIEIDPARLSEAANGSARIARAGYRGDRAHVLHLERDCAARPVPQAASLLTLSCGAVGGESGAALLDTGAGEPRVVGILVAGAKVETPSSPSLAVSVGALDSAVAGRLGPQGPSDRPSALEGAAGRAAGGLGRPAPRPATSQ